MAGRLLSRAQNKNPDSVRIFVCFVHAVSRILFPTESGDDHFSWSDITVGFKRANFSLVLRTSAALSAGRVYRPDNVGKNGRFCHVCKNIRSLFTFRQYFVLEIPIPKQPQIQNFGFGVVCFVWNFQYEVLTSIVSVALSRCTSHDAHGGCYPLPFYPDWVGMQFGLSFPTESGRSSCMNKAKKIYQKIASLSSWPLPHIPLH